MTSEFRKMPIIINSFGLPQDKRYHTAYRCRNCDTIVMSLHVHAFVACECFKEHEDNTGIFIDGGREYLRGGGKLENIETLIVKLR